MVQNFIFLGTGGLQSKIVLEKLIAADRKPLKCFIIHQENSKFINLTELICKHYEVPYQLIKKLNEKTIIEQLISIRPDFGIIAGFSEIIKQDVLNICPFYNIHPGKLPENRGAYPIFWDMLNDVDIYHISIHQIDEKLDSGKLIIHATIDLTSEIHGNELVTKIYEFAGNCAVQLFERLKSNSAPFVTIDISTGKYYPKYNEIDLELNPEESIPVLFKKINRIQFYGIPTIKKFKVYQASILFSGFMNIPNYELRELNDHATLLMNNSGILLLKHLTNSNDE